MHNRTRLICDKNVLTPHKEKLMLTLPCEGVDLFGELAEQDVLGGVCENQHYVHVSRPQLHQVAHVCDIRQLGHLHKVLLGRPTRDQQQIYRT